MKVPPRSLAQTRVRAQASKAARQITLPVQKFIYTEGVSGFFLLGAAILALGWANSPWAESYFHLWERKLTFDIGVIEISKTLHHWINDGLMAVFFFVVGLEIKRELIHGEISSRKKAALPIAGALGGMIGPALLYVAFNAGTPQVSGWGVPMATDIAFAVGVLALLGNRVSHELSVFLLALAIVDDLGSIAVIAIFYSDSIAIDAMATAVFLLMVLVALMKLQVRVLYPYVLVSGLVWLAVLESGVHATVAGVAVGFLVSDKPWYSRRTYAERAGQLAQAFEAAHTARDEARMDAVLGEMEELTRGTESTLDRLERTMHPWVSYVILPVFAFANSGITLTQQALQGAIESSVSWGIVAGLVLGKPLGIFLLCWIAVKSGLADLSHTTWRQLLGVGMVAGIGFTVALFIADLAFSDPRDLAASKIAILAASLVAGVVGYLFLRFGSPAPVVVPNSE